jgi:prevent-host-death family protein
MAPHYSEGLETLQEGSRQRRVIAPVLPPCSRRPLRRSAHRREERRGERERGFGPTLDEVARILYSDGPGGRTMTKTIPLKEARDRFSELVDKADRLSERFVVTKNGAPKAVVMSAQEFESWMETLEFMANPKAVKALNQGLREAKAGKFRSFKDVFGEDQ